MTPPSNWQNLIPFWNLDEIRQSEIFKRSYTNSSDTNFVSFFAYDKNTKKAYFVGMETRD
jgi:hypothetical protein